MTTLLEQIYDLEERRRRSEQECRNSRQRLQREAERMRRTEREEVLRAWLPIVDSMERALRERWQPDDPLHEGVAAIHRQMTAVLDRYEVRRVPGEPQEGEAVAFDPNVHEAVVTVRRDDAEEGSVAEVLEPGYMIEARVLRTAKVATVRGGSE